MYEDYVTIGYYRERNADKIKEELARGQNFETRFWDAYPSTQLQASHTVTDHHVQLTQLTSVTSIVAIATNKYVVNDVAVGLFKVLKLLGRVLSGVLGGILSPYPCDTTGSNHEAQHTARGGGRQRAARMHAKAIYVFYAEAATGARASVSGYIGFENK